MAATNAMSLAELEAKVDEEVDKSGFEENT